jgi:hypothetical protein
MYIQPGSTLLCIHRIFWDPRVFLPLNRLRIKGVTAAWEKCGEEKTMWKEMKSRVVSQNGRQGLSGK